MLWQSDALEQEYYFGLGMVQADTLQHEWVWMLWQSDVLERKFCNGLGMDALVTVCTWNTNVNVVWKWILSPANSCNTNVIVV